MNTFNNWSLCCISKTLSDQKVNFKSMTFTQFKKLPENTGMIELSKRILHNFETVHKTIKFCINSKIRGYRLSSSICPILTHSDVDFRISDLPNFSDIQKICADISSTIQNNDIRISAHPSEYISLSSISDSVVDNSIKDLEQHAEIFNLLGLPKDFNSPLNIHVRKEGNPQEIADTVMRNYDRLNDDIKSRLVFENNDNKNGIWSIENLYRYFYKSYKIPITFDTLHHSILPGNLSESDAFQLSYSTWPTNVSPLFHYSEGIVENEIVTRKHKDLPDSYPNIYNPNVFYDVELKLKEIAISKLQNTKQ